MTHVRHSLREIDMRVHEGAIWTDADMLDVTIPKLACSLTHSGLNPYFKM